MMGSLNIKFKYMKLLYYVFYIVPLEILWKKVKKKSNVSYNFYNVSYKLH